MIITIIRSKTDYACGWNNGDEMDSAKEETIEYFVDEFKKSIIRTYGKQKNKVQFSELYILRSKH